MSSKHIGSILDDFLQSEGNLDEVQALAINEVEVWQRTQTGISDLLVMPGEAEIAFDPPCQRTLHRPAELD